jgi:hypothetical protein
MIVVVRLVVVLAAVLIVVIAVRLVARSRRPSHPRIELGHLASKRGIVVFTSTDCANCREALAVVETYRVPTRQVSHELEPGEFDRVGVEAVPLTAVVGEGGVVTAVIAGIPARKNLGRAVARAGLA